MKGLLTWQLDRAKLGQGFKSWALGDATTIKVWLPDFATMIKFAETADSYSVNCTISCVSSLQPTASRTVVHTSLLACAIVPDSCLHPYWLRASRTGSVSCRGWQLQEWYNALHACWHRASRTWSVFWCTVTKAKWHALHASSLVHDGSDLFLKEIIFNTTNKMFWLSLPSVHRVHNRHSALAHSHHKS